MGKCNCFFNKRNPCALTRHLNNIQGVPVGFDRGVNCTCTQGAAHPNGLKCSLLSKERKPKEIR